MKLQDLRKLAIQQQARIRFGLSNSMECVVDENGVARIPGLRATLDVSLESELASAQRFSLEAVLAGVRPRSLSRPELQAMLAPGTSSTPDHDHDE
jgi:hypothetical protein